MPDSDPNLLRTERSVLQSGLFDPQFYRETYADIRASAVDPLTHYITHGEAEGRRPNPVFSPRYYRRHAMASGAAEVNALAHYAEEGERLGYRPAPGFDPRAYLAANPVLNGVVDRPLFHYLKIGRRAGLPVAPGPRGEALSRILGALHHAAEFEASGRRDHYPLMRFKQVLVRELGIEEGFALYRDAFGLPDSDRIEQKPIAGLDAFARERGAAFYEITPAGGPFSPPPQIIGEATHGAPEGGSRGVGAMFVACLIDARVRARSGVIETADAALVDGQGAELAGIGDKLAFDPAVFHAESGAAWIILPDEPVNPVELDEAFMLLGARSDDFGHWMLDLLPRYIAASASGALPPVAMLVDAGMPERQRQSLELMLPPGHRVIALPSFATARVRRLWCAPSQMHLPHPPDFGEPSAPPVRAEPPARLATSVREMVRRTAAIASTPGGPERLFLRDKAPAGPVLLNEGEIERAAQAQGFAVVDPEGLSFADQVRLLRHARFVIAAGDRQLPLAFFAQPGMRLCNLRPEAAMPSPTAGVLDEIGVEVSVLTGSRLRRGEDYPERPAYRVDPTAFGDFLDRWIEGDMWRVFSYWDKPDLSPVQATLDDWRAHFPGFMIFGDPDIEPIIEELFPQHLEMFRRIRIPTCKSDLALLLALYKFGGLYVDCHCGIRDPQAIRQLLQSLDHWQLILYDKNRGEAPRPLTEVYPLNSVLFAQPHSPIVLEAVRLALVNLAAHWSAEREHGFQPYHIATLSGPAILSDVLFIDVTSPISQLKLEYEGQVRFLAEDERAPIGRYMHYEYRVPGMHWSERQQRELLFECLGRGGMAQGNSDAQLENIQSADALSRGNEWGSKWPPNATPLPTPPGETKSRNRLESFFDSRKTGRGIWKFRHYFDIYQRHFGRFCDTEVHILEIGIYSGGSLEMWQNFFGPKAHIYGVDLQPECKEYESPSVKIFIGDQADRAFWRDFRQQVPVLDIVVDDGGHQPFQQIISLEELLPHLQQGGVYLCEDLESHLHPFASYVHGLAHQLNDYSSAVGTGDPERWILCQPTPLQQAIASVHLYPFVAVVEKNAAPITEFTAPMHGSQWKPW